MAENMKLGPCPFCGGDPEIKHHKRHGDHYEIRCLNDECTVYPRTSDWPTLEEAARRWSRRTPSEVDNAPLTLEELRGMDGEPVWIVAHPDWGHWELSECAEDYLEDRDEDFYGMTMPPALPDPMGRYGLHMLGWLAYRCPPERGE